MPDVEYLATPETYATEHFVVRSYRPGDGPLLRDATISSYEHLRTFMPWATEEQSEEEAERLVREFRGRYLLAEDFVLGMFTPDGGELMGGAGYHLREGPLDLRTAELGMWIRSSRAGKGWGSALLRALLEWGFDAWPWVRLSWRCDTRNAASRRIAEKAGMRLEGVLRDHLVGTDGGRRDTACYSLLRGQQ